MTALVLVVIRNECRRHLRYLVRSGAPTEIVETQRLRVKFYERRVAALRGES